MFGQNAQHTHVVAYEERTLTVSTAKRLVPLWTTKQVGTYISSPVVSHGFVYIASEDKNLYVYKATGCGVATQCQPLWYGSTGGMIDATPAIFAGKVYISSMDGIFTYTMRRDVGSLYVALSGDRSLLDTLENRRRITGWLPLR